MYGVSTLAKGPIPVGAKAATVESAGTQPARGMPSRPAVVGRFFVPREPRGAGPRLITANTKSESFAGHRKVLMAFGLLSDFSHD